MILEEYELVQRISLACDDELERLSSRFEKSRKILVLIPDENDFKDSILSIVSFCKIELPFFHNFSVDIFDISSFAAIYTRIENEVSSFSSVIFQSIDYHYLESLRSFFDLIIIFGRSELRKEIEQIIFLENGLRIVFGHSIEKS